MGRILDNITTADDYTDANEITDGEAIFLNFAVANASVFAQFRPIDQLRNELAWDDEVLITPQTNSVQRVGGFRVRSAVPGSPAQVVAQLFRPTDPLPGSGVPFLGRLATSGALTPLATVGQELAFQQFVAPVPCVANTEATANTIVTAPAFTADGVLTVMIEFWCQCVTNTIGGARNQYWLYEDGVSIGQLGQPYFPVASEATVPVHAFRRLVPGAGSRTYSVRGTVNAGTGTAFAGTGGLGQVMPGFIRIIQAV